MTRFEEVIDMMSKFSFTVEFDHVDVGTLVPFGTYTFEQPNISADNRVYMNAYQFKLRLFVEKLDATIRKEVVDALNAHELPFTVDTPIYISDSKIFEIDYNFGIISEG